MAAGRHGSLARAGRTPCFAEKSVDWTPDTPGAPLSTADVYYQLRAYLKAGFLSALPNEGVYLVRWENDVHGGGQECGGITLTRSTNPAEGRLRVVRQIACNAPDPPAPQTVIQSGATVKERQWIPIWVNQKLSGQANSCAAFALPFCTGAYTAATLGKDSVRISRTPNYTGGDQHVKRLQFGLMPVTDGGLSGSSLDMLMDCLGQSDPCGQELPIRAALYDPLAADRWGSPTGSGHGIPAQPWLLRLRLGNRPEPYRGDAVRRGTGRHHTLGGGRHRHGRPPHDAADGGDSARGRFQVGDQLRTRGGR